MTNTTSATPSPEEAQGGRIAARLNWLRAGVMGANDGIVSTAGLVVGVAGAAVSNGALLASGVAAVIAGAMSMGVGEYVSVSSQRDSQEAELANERAEIDSDPGRGSNSSLARSRLRASTPTWPERRPCS